MDDRANEMGVTADLDDRDDTSAARPAENASVPPFGRGEQAVARSRIERILPEPGVRRACLAVMAEAIATAHAISPASWGVTLHDAEVRLNVGPIETCVLRPDELCLTLDRAAVSPDQWRQMQEALGPTTRWGEKPFRVIPTAHGAGFPLDQLTAALPSVRLAHLALVERAARMVRTRTTFHHGHSPGVLTYLRQELGQDAPDPDYGLAASPATRVWLFQANPELYDMDEKLERVHPGDEDWWAVKWYRDEMRAGDTVLLWVSGKDAGIYATVELTGAPYQRQGGTNEPEVADKPYAKAEWRVDLRYTKILETPIRRERLKEHPVLRDMQILKNARGTNFKVSPEQWVALAPMIGPGARSSEQFRSESQTEGSAMERPDVAELLQRSLSGAGLAYTRWQIATFYTALQTKGFVILSGVSGTGKTKLAQHLAALLPKPTSAPTVADDRLTLTVRPYMAKYRRFILPNRSRQFFDLPAAGESWDVEVRGGNVSATCRLGSWLPAAGATGATQLLLKNPVAHWFVDRLGEGGRFSVEPDVDDDGRLRALRLVPEGERSDSSSTGGSTPGRNDLFLSVRPDWRDSKSLLGYFNPLTETYEWTPFLRFVLQAVRSFRERDGLAWFVILDEMNLAHVEYYFADFLSVLESGRDGDGWTREPLLLVYPEEAEGDLPPRELALPPNLYVVGTVNVDETTHAFSPKVLDRAFSLELSTVDFAGYPPTPSEGASLSTDEAAGLLDAFTEGGRFPRIDKVAITRYVAAYPEVRRWLQTLNGRLEPHNLHFGYRVFDEVVGFLDHAERNGTFDAIAGADPAFDAAVLMKVLPKFHGSRGKLEAPLRAVLAWCADPDEPSARGSDALLPDVAPTERRLPRTATRVLRMLDDLHQDGFTAFG